MMCLLIRSVCVCLLQGSGCDCGIHRVQHLVYQALLQRHAHSNRVFLLLLANPFDAAAVCFLSHLCVIRLLFSFLDAAKMVR